MPVKDTFPEAVLEEPNVWIPMSDGVRLAARVWRPEGSDDKPVPAILEYLPYRKRDGTAVRDATTHPYFAGHGYASVRVDMRGNGESDGLMWDEYLVQEQDDALEVIDWLVAQPWCSGTVGMIGISWGGFNGLQVAMRRPAALKAVVSICSTVDRYADDIHYKGGSLLLENVGWATQMLGYSSRPPDPALLPDNWREVWLDRLRNQPFLAETWFEHQRRDDYWKHGSVCEDWEAIQCPVLAVGGWADGYKNAVPALVEGLSAPAKGIIGPWIHKYPHFAVPGPRIGFLQECLRWWDRWLKGIENGAEDLPDMRVYSQTGCVPAASYDERPGDWVAEQVWPSPNISVEAWHLTDGGLSREAAKPLILQHRAPEDTGEAGGEYFCWTGEDLPPDQRVDDGRSLVFDTAPLSEDLEIVGAPTLRLRLSVDRPQANLSVRLSDILPTGEALRVSYGILNLSQRDGPEAPAPMRPGEVTDIEITLDHTAHRFLKGHRVRLAVSTAYWPLIWPSPEAVLLSIDTGGSRLELPVRGQGDGQPSVAFEPEEQAPPLPRRMTRAPSGKREVSRDQVSGWSTTVFENDAGEYEDTTIGLTSGAVMRERFQIHPDHPLSARYEGHHTHTLSREGWSVRTESKTRLTSDAHAFHLAANLEAFEGDVCVFSKSWSKSIPRRLL